MFHSNDLVELLVCYKVDLIDASGFIYVAISGGSYCILTGLNPWFRIDSLWASWRCMSLFTISFIIWSTRILPKGLLEPCWTETSLHESSVHICLCCGRLIHPGIAVRDIASSVQLALYAKHQRVMARTDAMCSIQSPSLNARMSPGKTPIMCMYDIQIVEWLPVPHLMISMYTPNGAMIGEGGGVNWNP